jgi:hypothetical protein
VGVYEHGDVWGKEEERVCGFVGMWVCVEREVQREKLKAENGERECVGLWVCGYVWREKFKEKN